MHALTCMHCAGRFEEARIALTRALASRELFGAPVLVLANKQDAPDAQPPEAVQSGLALEDLKVPVLAPPSPPNPLPAHACSDAVGAGRPQNQACSATGTLPLMSSPACMHAAPASPQFRESSHAPMVPLT